MSSDGLSLEFEWQQVSMNLLNIQADFSNAVVWMVSARPLISNSSSPLINHWGTIPSAPVITGITVTLMLSNFIIIIIIIIIIILLESFSHQC